MDILKAYRTTDIEQFMELCFPPEWDGIRARILETGATFADGLCSWAPRWSKIPLTTRKARTQMGSSVEMDTAFKSVIFRVHDCLHQLWGLPHPQSFSTEEFYYYKRTQMCGEVAVLTLAEFVFAKHLYDNHPAQRTLLWGRNAIPLLFGPLQGKSTLQIAMRLDDLLHKKSYPRWVRENEYARNFVADYVPMLEKDRNQIDNNWAAMKKANWVPRSAPKARFARHLDGLELTIWMIEDFYHLMSSEATVDEALMNFNRDRRSNITLPPGWDS